MGWMRLAIRDLRGDLRRFGVLIACLALGTSVIAAVGSVGESLRAAVDRDAATLLGGDLEASSNDGAASEDERAFLSQFGRVAEVIDTNSRAISGERSNVIDLLAVGENYPLRGQVVSPQLDEGQAPASILGLEDGVYGAMVDPVLFERMSLGLGDRFNIGSTEFEIRAELGSLPDSAVRGFQLGVTTVITAEAISTMSDLRPPLPGLLTQYRYKVMLEGTDYETAAAAIRAEFGDRAWSVRSPLDAAGSLVRFYDLFTSFLLIVGLSSLLVGGVGVYNGVTAYIGERQRSIATLRSLGATGSRVLVHFLTQIGVLAGIGVLIGALAGAMASLLILPVVGNALNVDLPAAVAPIPLLTAAAFGILVAFAFSFVPLMWARRVSPALLFRSLGSVLPRMQWRGLMRIDVIVPVILSVAAIYLLAIATTGDPALVGYYSLGVLVTFLLLRGAGWLFQAALRHAPQMPVPELRHALRNVYRPGSAAPVVIVSTGLGLAMLLVIVLLQSNLSGQLTGAVTKDAPTFVATDLFPDEIETLEQMQADDPGFAAFDTAPMLRGAILEVNGQTPEEIGEVSGEAEFLFSGEIPMTWRADLPAQSEVVAGEWWDADYDGAPLVSLRSSMQEDLGLAVGDTLLIRMFAETFEATVANFRDYQWQNGLNFAVTFSPGDIEFYPSTYLGSIKAAPGEEKNLERQLVRAFPNIAFLPIGEALDQVAGALGQLGTAVTIVGALAVTNGLLVLAGTMAAGRKQREADAVVQKVLGAKRSDVLVVFVLEYGLLGAFAAIIASVVGIGAAFLITNTALEIDFAPDPLLIGAVIVGAVLLTVSAGALTTWRVLSTSPARYLRTV